MDGGMDLLEAARFKTASGGTAGSSSFNDEASLSRSPMVSVLFGRLQAGFAVILLAAMTLGCIAWLLANIWTGDADINARDASVEHTYEVLANGDAFMAALASAETSARDVLMTDQPQDVAMFEHQRDEALECLGRLRRLTADNPAQQRNFAELDRLVSAKLQHFNWSIEMARLDRAQAVVAAMRPHEGIQVTQGIRGVTDAIIAEEERLLTQRRAVTAEAPAALIKRLRLASVVIVGLLLVTGVSAIWMVMRRRAAVPADIASALRDHDTATLRNLFAVSPVGMARSDDTGTVVEANPTYLRVLGATEADLAAGRINWASMTTLERPDQNHDILADFCQHGRCGPCEKEYMFAGRRVPVMVGAALLDQATGESAAFVSDLSEIRGARAELAESRGLTRSLFESTRVCVKVLDLDGCILSVDRAAFQQLGFDAPHSSHGHAWHDLWPETEKDHAAAAVATARAGQMGQFTAVTKAEDGTDRWWDVAVSPILGLDGELVRLLAVSRDITARKQAEMALVDSEARLRLAMHSAAIGVWEFDYQKGTVCFDERASALAGGLLPANVLASLDGPELTAFDATIHPDDLAAVSAIRRGETDTLDLTFRTVLNNGTCRSLTSRGVVVDRFPETGTARRMVGIMMDVTASVDREAVLEQHVQERTRALTETAIELQAEIKRREEAQTALTQTQKLEALGQLTGGIIHDCNNVLGVITGIFDMISSRTVDEKILKLVHNGNNAAQRAMGLVQHLLAFSRSETIKPVSIDLGALLADSQHLLRYSAGAVVDVHVDAETGLWPILADRSRLEVALINLAVNARDAMPKGGELMVKAMNMPANAPRPAHYPAGDCVVISVADTGCGMPPAVLARALEPFFTTKGVGKGTGLGLAMVHGFAAQTKGALDIQSQQNVGTTVSVVLPRNVAEPAAKAVAPSGGARPDAKILVVDDDDFVRATAATMLREIGYTVLEAGNAEAAYAVAHASRDVSLVVTDVVMPGADGTTLAARLRAEFADLPVVFVTGHPAGRQMDDEKVLIKPFTKPLLEHLVAEGLAVTA